MNGTTHEYLLSLGPNSVRLGLHRMQRALADLADPQQSFPTLLVAGTNGKGSTCAMVSAALRQAGYRVGLFTSPHLHSYHERMQVNGRPVCDGALADLVRTLRGACPWHDGGAPGDRLTFFEFATLLGVLYFAQQKVDVAVVETGLGGQFDATSVLRPQLIDGVLLDVAHNADAARALRRAMVVQCLVADEHRKETRETDGLVVSDGLAATSKWFRTDIDKEHHLRVGTGFNTTADFKALLR